MGMLLIVEDEQMLMDTLSRALEESGVEVLKAMDGKAGLDMALANKPELILLDLQLPVMDGISMLKKLREDVWGADAQVIVLTNSTDETQLKEARDLRVSEFLNKLNWKLEDIVSMVKTLMGK